MATFNVSIKSKAGTTYSSRTWSVDKFRDGRKVTSIGEAIEATRVLLTAMNEDPNKFDFTARPMELF